MRLSFLWKNTEAKSAKPTGQANLKKWDVLLAELRDLENKAQAKLDELQAFASSINRNVRLVSRGKSSSLATAHQREAARQSRDDEDTGR